MTDSETLQERRLRWMSVACHTVLIAMSIGWSGGAATALDLRSATRGLSPERASRFAVFEDFKINGVCGTDRLELASRFGVNTVRGYTVSLKDNQTLGLLDRAHALGMRVVLSEWMPEHGRQGTRDGKYHVDYRERGDQMVAKFREKVEALGDHPAVLMWGLGNEVGLDTEYLRVVNRMSEALHELYPNAISSLTMINAKPENIAKIKRYAPDIDVLGVQSYSAGAIENGIRNMEEHWGRPYYYSEFNARGPWNFEKTSWGQAVDSLPGEKVEQVRRAYRAIDRAPGCLGSTIFVWGHFVVNRPTYFSLLLSMDPTGEDKAAERLVTPQAEAMGRHFLGRRPLENRSPVLRRLSFADGEGHASVSPAQPFTVLASATDGDGESVTLNAWVVSSVGRRLEIATPLTLGERGRIDLVAPSEPGVYLVLVYATDGRGGGSGSTLPLRVQ